MGGDLGKLPSYVGYTDAVEKVLDLGKPEVEDESDDEEEEKKEEEEEEDEDEDEEDDDYEEEDVSVSMSSSSDDVNLEYNLRGFSDDEEEDEISLSMKELDERPSSVLSNGRSPAEGSNLNPKKRKLGLVDPNDPDSSESESDYDEDGKDGQKALFAKFFGGGIGNGEEQKAMIRRCPLHDDIERFASENVQNEAETSARDEIEQTVRETIQKYSFSKAQVHRFGSGATGLALKDADVDLVILGVGPQSVKGGGGGFTRSEKQLLVQHLRTIAKTLRNKGVCKRAEIISSAKVPIAKLDAYHAETKTHIKLDLAIGVSNGLAAAQWIREQVGEFPALKPLVLVLKRLLQIHKLNNAATGGCGGYLLISLVVSHLKQCTPAMRDKKDGLGDLLLGFFRRFGVTHDYETTAIAASRPTGTCSVGSVDVAPNPFGPRPFIICEDPQERSRNITASAYRFKEVKQLFEKCLRSMSSKNGLEFLEEIANAFKPPQNGNTVHVMRGGKKFTFKRPGPELIRLKGEKRAKPNTYKKPTAAELNGMWEESGGMNSRKGAIMSHRTGPWSAEHSFLANAKNSVNDNLNKFKRSEFKKTKREKMQAKKDKAERKKQKKMKQAIKSKKDHQTKKKAKTANASSSPTAEKKKKKPPTTKKKKSFQQKSPKKLTPASAVTTRSSNKKKK
jgi:DNA polymerase sigma